jgi:hypothetical protein
MITHLPTCHDVTESGSDAGADASGSRLQCLGRHSLGHVLLLPPYPIARVFD